MFRLGDRVRVQVLRVDTERRQIDLGIVDLLENARAGRFGPRRSGARTKSDRRSTAPRRRSTAPPRRRRRS
jgi:ribosomal protein S1